MAGLIPFNKRPSDLMGTGFDGFQNMLDDFFSVGWPLRRSLAADTFKIDVQDNEKDYVVEAELPGVDKEDVTVSLEEGRLTIQVNKEENTEQKDKNYIHRERRCTAMSRSLYLADAADEGVRGKLDNGVLAITVPKRTQSDRSYKIEIE